jgi:predicted nuclease with TOPRIM domain
VEEMRSRTIALQSAIAAMKQKIEENKQQKEDAVTYRGTKAKEVAEAEKVLSQEVMLLEQKREKLEAELAEVRGRFALIRRNLRSLSLLCCLSVLASVHETDHFHEFSFLVAEYFEIQSQQVGNSELVV